MKFVRYFFAVIVCLLAVYGGYQLYTQYSEQDNSDEFAQEMRDMGLDLGSGDSKEAISSIMQSDLGTPTSTFEMPSSGSSSLPPPGGGNGHPGGLPSSLRSSGGTSSVVPQPSFSPNVRAQIPTQTPVPPPVAPDSSATIIFLDQGNDRSRDSQPNFGQYDQSPPLSPDQSRAVPSAVAPDALSPLKLDRDIELSMAATSDNATEGNASTTASTTPLTTTAQTMLPQNTISFGTIPVETGPANATPLNVNATQSPSNAALAQSQQQPAQQLPEPSPYTFDVVTAQTGGSNHEIDTTIPMRESRAVVISPVMPDVPQPGTPCVQEMPAYRTTVATNPHLRQLPPIEDDPALTASVDPPVFIPRLNVTALPPVEDESAPTPYVETHVTAMIPPESGLQPLTSTQPEETQLPTMQEPPLQTVQTIPQPPRQHQQPIVPLQTVQQQLPQQQVAQSPPLQSPIVQVGGVTPLPQSHPASQNGEIAPEVERKVAGIGQLLAQDRVADAYEQLSNMYFYDEMTPQERQYVARHLDQLAGGLLFSKRHHVMDPPYVVRQGDTLESIATQYKITPALLRKLNGVPADGRLVAGSQMKVIRGPLDARIYPNQHELVVVTRGKYACRFPISVGSGYAGQTGNFTVQDKALDRAYQLAPGLGVIPPGDPNNPLGSRWIELSKEQGTIGVHGTNMPQTVGTTRQSAGIFGLREQDITEVYDMLVVGSNVTIVR